MVTISILFQKYKKKNYVKQIRISAPFLKTVRRYMRVYIDSKIKEKGEAETP